ncbi:MAG: ArsA-related P-loop ATPase [Thermoleophilaceae bacterium]
MPSLLDKRLVFVTGKGGVGKTTVAAALGLAAARAGKRTIVCEVAEQERLAGMFGHGDTGYAEVELAERLWAISIDPQRAQEEYLRDQLPSRTLAGMLAGSSLFTYLSAATPGLRELLTVGKVWELAQLERRDRARTPYDLVIVDAPATGHGLGLLTAPRTFRDVARVGPIARQAGVIHTFLSDPKRTGVVAVALPEETPVAETIELRRRLREELDTEVDAVVVNGLYPERFSGAESERIASADGDVRPPALRAALRSALSEHRRARTQRTQLRRLRRAVGDVSTLPFIFEPELGVADLERLSRGLERRL